MILVNQDIVSNHNNRNSSKMSAETDDIQMQPLDLSCPRRRSSCYDDGLAMTPPHVMGSTVVDLDRPHSAESDSDSERPRNFTKSALRMSSGSENEGPARKRFLSKYLYKDPKTGKGHPPEASVCLDAVILRLGS